MKKEPILLITPSLERVEKWLKLHGLDGPNQAFRIIHEPSQLLGFATGTLAYDYGESHNFMHLYHSSMFEVISSNKLRFTWLEDGVQFLDAVAQWHAENRPVGIAVSAATKGEPLEVQTFPSPMDGVTPITIPKESMEPVLIEPLIHAPIEEPPKQPKLFQWQDLFWFAIFAAILAWVIYEGYTP